MHNFEYKDPLNSARVGCLRGYNIVLLAVFVEVPFPSVSAKLLCRRGWGLLESHEDD